MTLLAIDIGNTRLKWALYVGVGHQGHADAQGAIFIERVDELGERDWRRLSAPTHILGCAVADEAVRRSVDEQAGELWGLTPTWTVARESQCGVVNGYDYPSRLGIDRWMALIGARQRLLAEAGSVPAIVVMIGTAVTVDAIDAHGRFLGGLIMPGHGIMLRALEAGTAGLHVPTGDVRPFPTNTSDALTTGGTYAITGAIERMAGNLREREGRDPRVLLTGGAAWKVAPALGLNSTLVESLIFDGLRAIAAETWSE